MKKIRVYLDSGASLPKDLVAYCECYQFPYDSKHRAKKRSIALALPCELTWEEANCPWEEANFTFADAGYSVPEILKSLVGYGNKRDCKHLASAILMQCQIFLTSDKKDIWSHREKIEQEYGFKVIHFPKEIEVLRALIKQEQQD